MSKHTPGPWEAKDTPSVGWEIKAKVDGCPGTPTIWHGHGGGNENGGRAVTLAYEPWVQFPPVKLQEMFAANAKLIAAAPDLLEALKAIIAAPYGVAIGDLERAKEAVAKAEAPTA